MDMKVLVLAIIAIAGIGLGITFGWTGSSQQGVDITVSCDEGVDHVTGSGIHCKDEFVDLYAEIKEGYAFLGWYDKDGKLLSDKKEYKVFTQRSTELVVKTMAGYEVTVYTMAGIDTVVGAGAHGFSEAVTLEATVKNGYTFAGWYGLDGKLLNEGPCYTYDKCADIILVAKTNEVDVGKGGIHYIWEDADVWIVTDWYTGDYVFSKTNYTFFDADLVPGIYKIEVYGPGMKYLGSDRQCVGGKTVKEFSWTSNMNTYDESWVVDYNYYFMHTPLDCLRVPLTAHKRITFVNDMAYTVKSWAKNLMDLSRGMTPLQRANFVLDFVQQCIVYESDEDYCGGAEYWKSPCETLFEGRGDSEDSAILYCSLMKCMGYDVALLSFVGEEYVNSGDMMASVALQNISEGTYYTIGSKNYLCCDTVNDSCKVGDSLEYHSNVHILILN